MFAQDMGLTHGVIDDFNDSLPIVARLIALHTWSPFLKVRTVMDLESSSMSLESKP